MRKVLPFIFLFFIFQFGNSQNTYDIVLKGGTVMDPETAFEGIRNVGIIGDKIVEISEEDLKGVVEIDVKGLVVSPGFIDLHVHGICLLYTSPSPRDATLSRMPSSA